MGVRVGRQREEMSNICRFCFALNFGGPACHVFSKYIFDHESDFIGTPYFSNHNYTQKKKQDPPTEMMMMMT